MAQTLYRPLVDQLKKAGYKLTRSANGSHRVFTNNKGQEVTFSANIRDKNLMKVILKVAQAQRDVK